MELWQAAFVAVVLSKVSRLMARSRDKKARIPREGVGKVAFLRYRVAVCLLVSGAFEANLEPRTHLQRHADVHIRRIWLTA